MVWYWADRRMDPLVREQRPTFAAPELESPATLEPCRNIQTAVSLIKIGGESIHQSAVRDHTTFTDTQMDTRDMAIQMDTRGMAILRIATRSTDIRVDQMCRLTILPMGMSEVT